MRKRWLLFLLVTSPAWGYRLTVDFANGFYWQSLPIPITVIDGDAHRRSVIERISRTAINEWHQRTGLELWDYQSSGGSTASGGGNVIRWSENFAAETKMDPVSVLAVAIRHTLGPYFARTEIVINGNHFLNQDTSHLRTTLTHELGHTMGLDHSEVSRAIMAPTLQNPYYGLDRDDVEGMTFANEETQNRQLTGYVSPLAFETQTSTQPLSCAAGVVSVAGGARSSWQGPLSLFFGMLISLVGRIIGFLRKLF